VDWTRKAIGYASRDFFDGEKMTKSASFSPVDRKENLRKAVRKKLTLPMSCRAQQCRSFAACFNQKT
jgi:hypothetical protein